MDYGDFLMPVFLLTKDLSCGSEPSASSACSDEITKKLKAKFPELKDGKNYHVSILHEKNNHIIFVCIYEHDNEVLHSSSNPEIKKAGEKYIAEFKMLDKNHKTITKGIKELEIHKIKNPLVSKYKGDMPTQTKLKNALE